MWVNLLFFLVSWSLFRLKSWWAWGTKLIFSACFTLLSSIVFIKLNCVCVCTRAPVCVPVCVRMCCYAWFMALCGGQRAVCRSCYYVRSPGMELGRQFSQFYPLSHLAGPLPVWPCTVFFKRVFTCSHPYGPAPMQQGPFLRPVLGVDGTVTTFW